MYRANDTFPLLWSSNTQTHPPPPKKNIFKNCATWNTLIMSCIFDMRWFWPGSPQKPRFLPACQTGNSVRSWLPSRGHNPPRNPGTPDWGAPHPPRVLRLGPDSRRHWRSALCWSEEFSTKKTVSNLLTDQRRGVLHYTAHLNNYDILYDRNILKAKLYIHWQ